MGGRIYSLSALFVLAFAFVSQAKESQISPSDSEQQKMSPGASRDTLGACLARIPKDASIGQVMIAEQSCWRDENERNPIQAVPGARSTSLRGAGSVAMGNQGRH